MKQFRTAPMDKLTLALTIIFGAICAGVFVAAVISVISGELFMIFPGVVVLVVFVSSYLMIPSISVDREEIRVKNYFVNFPIKISEIAELKEVGRLQWVIRSFGVGGLFGNFGYFNGNDVWYVTNLRKKVQITMSSGKIYMLSPEAPEEFINTVKNKKDSP
ncbi:MAG: hypothetical protein BGO40_13425 [Chryseobacterium sp. 39-10]|nr:hypothetical protein [Chryseobacterium sp.]OJV49118.1 MAG: hypothetical protein BGO40_13425 [Chryseobacterium sp. 39-10]